MAGVSKGKVSPSDPASVVKGASRGFGVLLIGGLLQPLTAMLWAPLAYVWLLAVAIAAFLTASVVATPPHTPPSGWRQGPYAALGSYALIIPLVVVGSGELPVLQLVLTTSTAIVLGAITAVTRTRFYAQRPVGSTTQFPSPDR